jgi:hypothetical protein
MPSWDAPGTVKFGGPAVYRVVIQGVLKPGWSDRFAGMTITSSGPDISPVRTTLVGSIRDHTELYAVLDALYDLHLPILKVEQVAERFTDTQGGDHA